MEKENYPRRNYLKMTFEMVESETLDTHNPHDGLRGSFCQRNMGYKYKP